ncbi:Eco57I restriction-modification methylase domain-containing protein [Halarchaeum salinum]|uniref:site-specific DNA-methyltransferase (adenine-specific) n=1 Tax=Halarchaeum salinum TaxID=489912 RepID=A0AAV3SAP8_9EURY
MQQTPTYRTNRDLFSNHYLDDHLRETEPWQRVDDADVREAYDAIHGLWEEKRERVADYNEAQLERNVIRPIFEILGIPFEIEETVRRNARRPDYGFFPSADAADAAFDREDFYAEAVAVADAKRWGRKLDTRGEAKRDFENPSYQIHAYLQETPVEWAVLTNGRRWRLYYGPTSHRLDSYYEIDLPAVLDAVESGGDDDDAEMAAFKEFYCFFRHEAFLPDSSGDCFLDRVHDESSVFAEAIGEDLQDNIYEAIRVLAAGFLDANDDVERADLDLVHDASLIYLYRLIFVLYAESEGRDLLPTDNDIYADSYALNDLKREVTTKRDETRQQYQPWQTTLWDTLDELFELIDQGSEAKGIDPDTLYVPAYNGGLFRTDPDPDDSAEARFLAAHHVGDQHLAEVIDLLTRRAAEGGDGRAFVDYSSLDERHLGSIYEGLLEYRLDVADEPLALDDGEYAPADEDDAIAVEAGDVYLRTDAGERKATGSYYTPEYVVEYIVDETLGPLVDDIREDLLAQDPFEQDDGGRFAEEFAERVFELTVLDPAMGSGHFLVNAVDYLAREIIDAQERQDEQAAAAGEEARISDPRTDEGELRDINWARRKVAQRCLYGVDLNPLATELAKVSLWLRTLAAEQPLAFLDHHLKTGNSLVGSDIEAVLGDAEAGDTDAGQLTLQQSFDHTRQQALEHVMERFTDLLAIDNETLSDIKEMEAVYEDVRDDDLYQHLLAMANVHTAADFGLDVPDDAEERMATALRDDAWGDIDGQDWFQSAQAMADEEAFFHWELEFPVAFYGEDGERLADAGFDAVIGNPPWVGIRTGILDETLVEYLRDSERYVSATGQFDLAAVFLDQAVLLAGKERDVGFVVPKRIATNESYEDLRDRIAVEKPLVSAIDLGVAFEGVNNDALILIFGHARSDSQAEFGERVAQEELKLWDMNPSLVQSLPFNIIPVNSRGREVEIVSRLIRENNRIESYVSIERGAECGMNHESIVNSSNENTIPVVDHLDVGPYAIDYSGNYIDTSLIDSSILKDTSIYTSAPKLLVRFLAPDLTVAKDTDGYASTNLVYHVQCNPHVDFLCGLLSSKPLSFWYFHAYQNDEIKFPHVQQSHLNSLPVPDLDRLREIDSGIPSGHPIADWETDVLTESVEAESLEKEQFYSAVEILSSSIVDWKTARNSLNLSLRDYLGNYAEGPKLPDVGLYQPTGANILDATAEDYEKLRVGEVRTKRDGGTITIEATARYKPENEEEFETDQWGYTETNYFEAFALADCTETEAALIEAFVPVAVAEADGFAGFRDNATKTNSLVDRLKAITLPDPDDVAADLERYAETKARADELDAKIEETDALIDEIVYDLYGLTEEEIEIVEEAVGE